MSIRELREHYRRVWREDVSFEEEKELIAALLEHHDREHLAFHFDLLRNREHFYVYCSIRAAFVRSSRVQKSRRSRGANRQWTTQPTA